MKDLVPVPLKFPRSAFLLMGASVCGCKTTSTSLVSYPFYVCGIGCNVLYFISNVAYFSPSLFFLVRIVKGLSILFIFSKKQLLVSLIFSIFLLLLISFISLLIFVISSLLLPLGLVCPFFFLDPLFLEKKFF